MSKIEKLVKNRKICQKLKNVKKSKIIFFNFAKNRKFSTQKNPKIEEVKNLTSKLDFNNVDPILYRKIKPFFVNNFFLGDNFAINMDDVMHGLEDDVTDIEEVKGLELNQQPLAVALWISAAIMPSGMPNWFGPLNKNEPTAVRIALHIQVQT